MYRLVSGLQRLIIVSGSRLNTPTPIVINSLRQDTLLAANFDIIFNIKQIRIKHKNVGIFFNQMLHLFGIFLLTLLPIRDSEAFHLTTLSQFI